LDKYSAAVMTSTANATPNVKGTISQANAARNPCSNRNPSIAPMHVTSAIVTKILTTSANNRASTPDARFTGITQNRASSPSSRSRMSETALAVDPKMAPTSAAIGTLP
jgi:hypothetical protein